MMKLYEYRSIDELNKSLDKFSREGIPVKKVKLLTVGEDVIYYVLIDTSGNYQKND